MSQTDQSNAKQLKDSFSKPMHYTVRLDTSNNVIINNIKRSNDITNDLASNETNCGVACNYPSDQNSKSIVNSKSHNEVKKLSFVRDDDEDENDEVVVVHSKDTEEVELLQHKKNNLNNKTMSHSGDKMINGSGNNNNNNTTRKDSSTRLLAKEWKTGGRNDERVIGSPNSLSCDDDRFSESLDYDEDSVKGSPLHARQSRPPSTTSKKPIFNNSSVNVEQSNSLSKEEHTEVVEIDSEVKNTNGGSSSTVQEDHAPSDDTRDKQGPSVQARIKSFLYTDSESRTEDINTNRDKRENQGDVRQREDSDSSGKPRKSYHNLLRYFFKDACYFQIKSINHENVQISKNMNVWATSYQNEIRLNAAFKENRTVILIFSVQQSSAFQGFARMVSEARPSSRIIPWILPERLSNKSLGGTIHLEWLCTEELSFQDTMNLVNPYNDNKPVKVARDGQQLEPKVGKRLCKLFPRSNIDRLMAAFETLKRQAGDRKKNSKRYDSIYPPSGPIDRRSVITEERNHSVNLMHGPIIEARQYPVDMDVLSRIGFSASTYNVEAYMSELGPTLHHVHEPIIDHQTGHNINHESNNFRIRPRRRTTYDHHFTYANNHHLYPGTHLTPFRAAYDVSHQMHRPHMIDNPILSRYPAPINHMIVTDNPRHNHQTSFTHPYCRPLNHDRPSLNTGGEQGYRQNPYQRFRR